MESGVRDYKQQTVMNYYSTNKINHNYRAKDRGHTMPPQLQVCNGLTSPAAESMLARDIGTMGRLSTGHS